MSVNKSQLIEKIAKDAEISKVNASAVVQALITDLTKALKKDGKVTLQGFGTFTKTKRKARKGVNPRTGETIRIKASSSVKFKSGKALKAAL